MDYYTQRHGMRSNITKTHIISPDKYALLLRCCEKYYDNIAWKYPAICPDGDCCCGLDHSALVADIKYEIPDLFRDEYDSIAVPLQRKNIFEDAVQTDPYDQFALLDYIEFIAANIRDLSRKTWHSYYRHNDIGHYTSNAILNAFIDDINAVFSKTGLLYNLTADGIIERIEEQGVLNENIENAVAAINEVGLRELLQTAIALHKSPHPADNKDAVEKIWDALERMKTYYTDLDKKQSVTKIVNEIGGGVSEFVTLFNDEFITLTNIGNKFRIRHHETDKIDITDIRHYDYFFNRCLSLIALSLQYLH